MSGLVGGVRDAWADWNCLSGTLLGCWNASQVLPGVAVCLSADLGAVPQPRRPSVRVWPRPCPCVPMCHCQVTVREPLLPSLPGCEVHALAFPVVVALGAQDACTPVLLSEALMPKVVRVYS